MLGGLWCVGGVGWGRQEGSRRLHSQLEAAGVLAVAAFSGGLRAAAAAPGEAPTLGCCGDLRSNMSSRGISGVCCRVLWSLSVLRGSCCHVVRDDGDAHLSRCVSPFLVPTQLPFLVCRSGSGRGAARHEPCDGRHGVHNPGDR